MSFSTPPLIAPPKEDVIYPYRRVWRSLIQETIITVAICAATFLVYQFIGLDLPQLVETGFVLLLALMPLILWILFSRFAETRVQLPRAGLNTTLGLSALSAAAIGVPLVNTIIEPSNWLSLESALTRIVGYMLTAGIVQEFIKFIVVRYVSGPRALRIREDSIAYCIAAAVGYMTVLNLIYVFDHPAAGPDMVSVRVLHHMSINVAGSLIMSYGIAQTWFGRVSPLLMPLTLLVAAFINGLVTPLRSGLANASLLLTGASASPLFSVAFSSGIVFVAIGLVLFFYRVVEEQERISRESGSLT